MLNKDAVVGMLKNYLLPGAYPVAKADIEITINFIESQTRDAELGREYEEETDKYIAKQHPKCKGKYDSMWCEENEFYYQCKYNLVCKRRVEIDRLQRKGAE